jgi:hypothetical protein
MTRLLPAFALFLAASPAGAAAVLSVPADYARVTDALAAAQPGDTVRVAAGSYSAAANGEVFPLPLAVSGVVLEGAGMGLSTLDAAQAAGVVHCTAQGVRVTGFTITGGRADKGAGVWVQAGDARVDHNAIVGCAAITRGSAVFADTGSQPWIHHNVSWHSMDALPGSGGDPHGIQITNSNALVEFNTIGRGDSNGLIVEGTGEPIVRNNIFFENGSAKLNRGRGICALGGAGTVIRNNVFHGNYIAAILVRVISVVQDLTAQQANDADLADGILENYDADPALLDANAMDVHLTAGSPAIDAGWIGSPVDPDGTRADAGAFFYDQAVIGVGDAPGPRLALAAAPNPFRSGTLLSYALARAGRARLTIVNARGQLVETLFDGERPAGRHDIRWEGAAAAGVYFARLEADGRVTARTLVLVSGTAP